MSSKLKWSHVEGGLHVSSDSGCLNLAGDTWRRRGHELYRRHSCGQHLLLWQAISLQPEWNWESKGNRVRWSFPTPNNPSSYPTFMSELQWWCNDNNAIGMMVVVTWWCCRQQSFDIYPLSSWLQLTVLSTTTCVVGGIISDTPPRLFWVQIALHWTDLQEIV